ncbi:MAG: hypothetical protein GYA55_14325 [SAR324 cluster bacterium]|uniref:Uncharacterized protein n=1 Tax=SAR324 cluster bacterium TaxID=2024889 RepID=A0A7X9FU16_9DELT|nr:hypothetical protein [SAR324 cluster bacterium]
MNALNLIKTLDYCRSRLPLSTAEDDFRFVSIPLATLKAVSSIGTKTPLLTQVIDFYYDNFVSRDDSENSHYFRKTGEVCVSDFINFFADRGIEQMSSAEFKQEVPSLPEQAINAYVFCRILRSYDVEYSSDLNKIVGNKFFEKQIRNIPGQRNGNSLKFFYMYTGIEYSLPARELRKFIFSATNKNLGISDCTELIGHVAKTLRIHNTEFTHELLEKLIWSYQLAQKKLHIVWQECDRIPLGHGVYLYDKKRRDSSMYGSDVVASIEGYSFEKCLSRGDKLPLKGYCIEPDEITTLEMIDEMKFVIEELMKIEMPRPNSEIISNRIFSDLGC